MLPHPQTTGGKTKSTIDEKQFIVEVNFLLKNCPVIQTKSGKNSFVFTNRILYPIQQMCNSKFYAGVIL